MNNAIQRQASQSRQRSQLAVCLSMFSLLIGGFVQVGIPLVTSGQDQGAEQKKKPIINFRMPERAYQIVKRGRWSIEVEKQLIDEAPIIAMKGVKRLQDNLDEVFRVLPKAAQPVLKELKLFVMYGPKARGGGLDNGMEYFANNAPKFHGHLDERWSSCVVVYCAENYTQQSNLWALKALIHEYGHAHHREHWPEDQPDIMAAWKNAVDKGLYVNVREDNGKTISKAYAITNQLEYFAELTAIYFARCNYAPFDRAAIKKYDPVGFAMIQKMWGLSKADPAPPSESDRAQ